MFAVPDSHPMAGKLAWTTTSDVTGSNLSHFCRTRASPYWILKSLLSAASAGFKASLICVAVFTQITLLSVSWKENFVTLHGSPLLTLLTTDAGNIIVTEKRPQVPLGLAVFTFLTGVDSAPVVQCNESLSNTSSGTSCVCE